MADTEVEETLREIRERVRAAASRAQLPATQDAQAADDGDEESLAAAAYSPADGDGRGVSTAGASGALARMEANLSTTERTWNRLPPLLSNRDGWVARLELWLKRKVKRAAHWFTWEQVNFNSSVHHSLRDARAALAAHEQIISRMQSESASLGASLRQAKAEAEAERTRVDARLLELGARLASAEERLAPAEARLASAEARLTSAEARLASAVAQLRQQLASSIEQLSSNLVQLRDEHRAHAGDLGSMQESLVEAWRTEQSSFADGLRGEQQERLADFEREVGERMATLLDEQRVCFRQLSLEAGETAVVNDRDRRLLESRLEALEMKAEDKSGV